MSRMLRATGNFFYCRNRVEYSFDILPAFKKRVDINI